MAHHRDDLVVDEFLRHLRGRARVGRVVLRVQFERHLLSANQEALLVDFVDGKTRSVLFVLAEVGDLPPKR